MDESDHLTLVNAGPGDEEVVSQEEGERTARGRGAPQGPGPGPLFSESTVTECLPPASVQVTITVTPL